MTTLTLIKPNPPSQIHYSKVNSKINFIELAYLINECKRTSHYPIANIAFVSALHYAAPDSSISMLWESQQDWSNCKYGAISHLVYYDLLILKQDHIQICIPVSLLKPWVQESCFYQIQHIQKEKAFRNRLKHNRTIVKSPPGQNNYLLNKLANLVPNYQKLAEKYLQPKP